MMRLELNWDGDKTKRVIAYMSDYHCLVIRTENYRVFVGSDGEEHLKKLRHSDHSLLYADYFIGKLRTHVYESTFARRDLKQWERDIYQLIREIGLKAFISTFFGKSIQNLPWGRTVSSYDLKDGKDYDMVEEVEDKTVTMEEQAESLSAQIQHVRNGKAHLEKHGFGNLSKCLNSAEDSLVRDLRALVYFEKISIYTPDHEIPTWVRKGKTYEQCKKRKTELAIKYEPLLGE